MCVRLSIGVTTLSPFSSVSRKETGNETLTVIKTTQSSGIVRTKIVYLQNFPDLLSRGKTAAGNITLPLESSTIKYAELK